MIVTDSSNVDEVQEMMASCYDCCELFLVWCASIIGTNNSLISKQRDIVEKKLKNVGKEGVEFNKIGEEILPLVLWIVILIKTGLVSYIIELIEIELVFSQKIIELCKFRVLTNMEKRY